MAGKQPTSDKARRWLAEYQSGKSALDALYAAGYQCSSRHSAEVLASKMLKKYADLLEADGKRGAEADARQAGIDEIRRFWAATMRDSEAELKDRLKASELAARSMGAFVERREVVQEKPFEVSIKVVD